MLPSKQQQQKIWRRVYGSLPTPRPQPLQALRQCRRRAMENLRFFQARSHDPIYGPAYERLTELSRQQLAMLEHIK